MLKHVTTMVYVTHTALIVTACSGDDPGANTATEGIIINLTESNAKTGASTTTTGEATNTASSTSSTSSTSSATSTSTTVQPETTGGTDSTGETDSTTGDVSVEAFRITEMYVQDPHFFIVPILGCEDATNKGLVGLIGINDLINEVMVREVDGLLYRSSLLLFRPLDQSAAEGNFEFARGDCTAPIESTTCEITAGTKPSAGTYANLQEVCLEPVPGELSLKDYEPKPNTTLGPCFRGDPLSFTLDQVDFQFPLIEAEIAAHYVGDPADGLVKGLIRGFLAEETADATFFQEGVPLLSGSPLSVILPGGKQNCATHDDRDMFMGISGWWFYIDFEATRVAYTGE